MIAREIVIAAFPATGKSHLAEQHPDALVDSDSSRFSWKWTGFGSRERHPDWPLNYITHISGKLRDGKSVLVSTHQEVRNDLVAVGIPFVLVYPRADLRTEYAVRMRRRGSPSGLIEAVVDGWFGMLRSCQQQTGCTHVVLGPGEFLRWPL